MSEPIIDNESVMALVDKAIDIFQRKASRIMLIEHKYGSSIEMKDIQIETGLTKSKIEHYHTKGVINLYKIDKGRTKRYVSKNDLIKLLNILNPIE